tara:strand:- start:6 stop:422 length:417 start_codon:yes stop_codon:yes gene_type:complete
MTGSNGIMNPTSVGMIGKSPAQSSMMENQNRSASQANANNLMAGGRFRKSRKSRKSKRTKVKRGGGTAVPQMHMSYKPAGGPGTGPNSQIAAGSSSAAQQHANKQYDHLAGGSSSSKWGCMSGGKRRRCTKRRTRRHH